MTQNHPPPFPRLYILILCVIAYCLPDLRGTLYDCAPLLLFACACPHPHVPRSSIAVPSASTAASRFTAAHVAASYYDKVTSQTGNLLLGICLWLNLRICQSFISLPPVTGDRTALRALLVLRAAAPRLLQGHAARAS